MVANAFISIIVSWHLTSKYMSDELDQETEPTNTGEEVAQEPATNQEEPDVETLKAQLELAKTEKDLQHKRATKAEAELKKLKPLTTNSSDSDRDLLVDLRLEGHSKAEAEFILRNGGRSALEDPLVMGAIETARKKTKSVDATPSGTAKSAVYQKYTEPDLRRMSEAELEKILPQ